MVTSSSSINSSVLTASIKGKKPIPSGMDILRLAYKVLIFAFVLFPQTLVANTIVYFGTSGKNSKGIYKAKLNTSSGKLSEAELAAEINKPSFLAWHPDRSKIFDPAHKVF